MEVELTLVNSQPQLETLFCQSTTRFVAESDAHQGNAGNPAADVARIDAMAWFSWNVDGIGFNWLIDLCSIE